MGDSEPQGPKSTKVKWDCEGIECHASGKIKIVDKGLRARLFWLYFEEIVTQMHKAGIKMVAAASGGDPSAGPKPEIDGPDCGPVNEIDGASCGPS